MGPSLIAKATPGQVPRTNGRTEPGSALPLRESNLLGRSIKSRWLPKTDPKGFAHLKVSGP
jgi:hypothetical protein